MPIDQFRTGSIETIRRLNEIVDAVNALEVMRGGPFIRVNKTPIGVTFSLNHNALKQRIGKGIRGGGGGRGDTRKAWTKTSPGAATEVTCYLDLDGTQSGVSAEEITVYVDPIYAGGGNLDTAEPALTPGVMFWVKYDSIDSKWRNVTPFFNTLDCESQ